MKLPTHTPILRLPSEKVQQRSQRLPNQTETDPKDEIASDFPLYPLDLLNHVCERNERDLEHHACKSDANDIVSWHADKQLMQDAGEKEDEDLREGRRPAATYKRAVNVAAHEVCDGLVPGRPVGADTAHVPPVAVELAVAEPHDLCQSVERRLEQGEEAAQPAEDGDGGEFHDTLGNGCKVEREDLVQ